MREVQSCIVGEYASAYTINRNWGVSSVPIQTWFDLSDQEGDVTTEVEAGIQQFSLKVNVCIELTLFL